MKKHEFSKKNITNIKLNDLESIEVKFHHFHSPFIIFFALKIVIISILMTRNANVAPLLTTGDVWLIKYLFLLFLVYIIHGIHG